MRRLLFITLAAWVGIASASGQQWTATSIGGVPVDMADVQACQNPGASGEVLTCNASGEFDLQAAAGGGMSDLVDDTSPQLGGDLDVNDFTLTNDAVGADVVVEPGSGGFHYICQPGGTIPADCYYIYFDGSDTRVAGGGTGSFKIDMAAGIASDIILGDTSAVAGVARIGDNSGQPPYHFHTDNDSGLGWAGADNPSIYAGSVQALGVDCSSGTTCTTTAFGDSTQGATPILTVQETGGTTFSIEFEGTVPQIDTSGGIFRWAPGTTPRADLYLFSSSATAGSARVSTAGGEGGEAVYHFHTDNDTGVGREGANTLGLYAGSTSDPIMEVTTTGANMAYSVGGTKRPVSTSAHGALYEKDLDGTPGNSISITTGGTYYAWTTGTAGITAGGVTTDVSGNATCSALDTPYACCTGSGTGTCGDLLIPADAGDYDSGFSVSFSDGNSNTINCCLFVNDAAPTGGPCAIRKLGTGGDVGNMGASAPLTLTASDEIDLRCTSASGENGITMSLWAVHLWVKRL